MVWNSQKEDDLELQKPFTLHAYALDRPIFCYQGRLNGAILILMPRESALDLREEVPACTTLGYVLDRWKEPSSRNSCVFQTGRMCAKMVNRAGLSR